MNTKRTLYECSHARVETHRIYCDKGFYLSSKSLDGSLDAGHLAKGLVLAAHVCQKCVYFDPMGPPVPEEERGWLQARKALKNGLNTGEAVSGTAAR